MEECPFYPPGLPLDTDNDLIILNDPFIPAVGQIAPISGRLLDTKDEPQPSEADIKVTRDLIRAGQLLKLEVLDHVIVGNPNHCSLRELGCFYT